MVVNIIKIIRLLSRFGVVHREEVKNDLDVIHRFLNLGLIRKVHRNRKVFYELTEKALPLLEAWRKAVYEEAKIVAAVHKPPSVYHALIGDVRFIDERHPAARAFQFLGDWQLSRPVVSSQIKLAQLRYYREH